MSATTADVPRAVSGRSARSGWGWLRVGLLVWLGLVLVATLVTGTRPASWGELQVALGSGELTAVTLVGELPPEAVGQAHVEILWHDGLLRRYTTVQQVRGDAHNTFTVSGDAPVVSPDLAAELAGYTPARELDVVSEQFDGRCGFALYDWCVPGTVALTGAAWGLAGVLTLVAGPQPRLATRWAWFWLLYGLGPAALVAYLVVGLRPGSPEDGPADRRLTGVWAFLLAVVLLGPAS